MTDLYFPVKLKLRIDWGDLDYLKHVNNVAFFKYIQSARVNYIHKVGLAKMYNETEIGPIVVSCKCDFIKPLFFPGNITIQSRLSFIKNTSFGISYRIIDDKEQLSAEALDVIVVFDFNRNVKVPLPQNIRWRMEKLEKRTF
jgi:acyl-CoA thioester hydrolase